MADTRMTDGNAAVRQRVAVVVATHDYCYPMEKCLAGFAAQLSAPADVILVDNGSRGKVVQWARNNAPSVTTLVRETNGFFCGGYNEGLRHAIAAGYDFALIVNADTEVCNPRLIEQLLEVARRHPRAAFIGPQVYLREAGHVQNTVLEFPSFARNAWSFVQFKLLNGVPPRSDDREREVEYLNGVCVLCRVAALREIGLLDEAMGGYVEDVDWSWRARALGWTSAYTPLPSIVHHQPETGYEHYSMKCFMLRRNTIYWHSKRGARLEAALYGWSARFIAWARALRAAVSHRPDLDQFVAYARRLTTVDRKIRRGTPVGEWFGPPFAPR
jgi:N-acetylglucosaminyl-diphospho-decaprenol L-rhamnosyltransferase